MTTNLQLEYAWMKAALEEAKLAMPLDVPVGALVLDSMGKLITQAHNGREQNNLLSGHAELIALDKASQITKDWRLTDCTLYVTLEPCVMCAGAIIQSRLKKVVFGAYDVKAGAMGSVMNLHKAGLQVVGGILEDDCASLLREFFEKKR